MSKQVLEYTGAALAVLSVLAMAILAVMARPFPPEFVNLAYVIVGAVLGAAVPKLPGVK